MSALPVLPMRRPSVGDVVAQVDPVTGEQRRGTIAYIDHGDADSVSFMVRPDGQPDRKAWLTWWRKLGERQAYILVGYGDDGQLSLLGGAS